MAEVLQSIVKIPPLPRTLAVRDNRRMIWIVATATPLVAAIFLWDVRDLLQFNAGAAAVSVILFFLLATCAITDSRWRIIPNWATYPAFVGAMVFALVTSMFQPAAEVRSENPPAIFDHTILPVGIAQCIAGALVCFLIMLVVYSVARGGAGDVKLATAIGALIGVKAGVLAICYTFILAGITAVAVFIWILGPWYVVKLLGRWVGNVLLPFYVLPPTAEQSQILVRPLPLGIFFAIGTITAVLDLPRIFL